MDRKQTANSHIFQACGWQNSRSVGVNLFTKHIWVITLSQMQLQNTKFVYVCCGALGKATPSSVPSGCVAAVLQLMYSWKLTVFTSFHQTVPKALMWNSLRAYCGNFDFNSGFRVTMLQWFYLLPGKITTLNSEPAVDQTKNTITGKAESSWCWRGKKDVSKLIKQ